MRHIAPTGSYSVSVPEDVIEEEDGRVVNLWMKDQHLLLQVSSFFRSEGAQIGAAERISALLKRQPLLDMSLDCSLAVDCPDYASAKGVDEHGSAWVYAYAVWPDLALMITVSGDEQEFMDENNWAFAAVRSIRRGK